VKWLKSQIKTYPRFGRNEPVIVIYRSHILRLKEFPKPARDQLIIELATDMGLRSGEISTLRIENIDLERGRLLIVDSKRKQPYPVPLTYDIAKHIEEVKAGREEGLLILQDERNAWRRGKPVTTIGLCYVWKKWARKAKLPNWRDYNPRLGRHYFACEWAARGGNIETLRRILRHKSLLYTQIYLSRLIFYEDIENEYKRIMNIPNIMGSTLSRDLNPVHTCIHEAMCKHYKEHEGHCIHEAVCKHFATEKLSVRKAATV
jgi:integrase